VLLCLVGVALVILPVVPGFPLVIIGVLMIAAASAAARNLLNNVERRLPTAVRARLRRLARKEQETVARHLHHTHESAEAPTAEASQDTHR
jgi:flagellar biosynthesis component FlhA